MTGIVVVSNDSTWRVSNWIYWNLMDEVLKQVSTAPLTVRYVEECKWAQLFDLHSLLQGEKDVDADTVLAAFKAAARSCSRGEVMCEVDGRTLSQNDQLQFMRSTTELVELLEAP